MGQSTFSGSIRSIAGVDFISSKDAATDLGIDRQSSTVLEVNNGTPVADGGAYRDLKVRTLTATGLSSQETIVATTSVTTPLVTNAGTLALSATGANVITLATNGTERLRVTSAGKIGAAGTNSPVQPLDFGTGVANEKIIIGTYTNGNGWTGIGMDAASAGIRVAGAYAGPTEPLLDVGYYSYDTSHTWTNRLRVLNNGNTLFGGTTNGDYRLDVQSSGSSGTLRVYDQTATTGSSLAEIRAGAGQSTNDLLQVKNNAGTVISRIFSDGTIGISTKTPASAAATGTAGQICWDASYLYVCTATDTWKRVAIATW